MGNQKILVIEDDQLLETVFDRIIHSISPKIQVDWATSAQEAMTCVQDRASKEDRYDLIIADIFLEGNDTGLDFLQNCQSVCPEAMMLMMSSLTEDEYLSGFSHGAIAPPFLMKPIRTKECRRMIEGLLDYSRRQ